MRKSLRIGAVVLAILLPLVGLSALAVYHALRQVPGFYREAIASDPAEREKASSECLQQASALASDVHKQGRWQALFTAEQINGWLAVDLVKNYPDLLNADLHDPRVAIHENEATIACRYESENVSGVYSLTFDVYLTAPNEIAVRIIKARVGMLPIPLGKVLEGISAGARSVDLPLRWCQDQGDPVALVTLPSAADKKHSELEFETIQLREGELVLAGHTQNLGPQSAPVNAPSELDDATAQDDSGSSDEPRVLGSATNKNRQR